MCKKSYLYLIFFIIFITCFSAPYSPVHSMEGEKGFSILQAPTPIKSNRQDYQGYILTEEDKKALKDVPVQLCTSLGKSCNTKISEYIEGADEFVVVFMYRFNSPIIINSLANKYLKSEGKIPVLVFLDYNQSIGTKTYHNYIKHLTANVPTSLVKAGSKSFHQKVTICKKKGEEAFVILGSANATFEADNIHSEDSVIIQSNKLAAIYVGEFYKFLTMNIRSKNKQVITFHDHRLEDKESNTKQLIKIKRLLEKSGMEKTFRGHGTYNSNIVSLAISTGFLDGNTKCLDVFKKAIEKEKIQPLILFENYLTIPPQDDKDLWKNLLNETPKLIVLDEDKHNSEAIKELTQQEANTVLLFRPYTRGKFHHKLLINYPEESPPIIYTGSFHLSANAVANNSENIIGIANKELAENYISSILWQSTLTNQEKVWEFISYHPEVFSESEPIQEVAQKTFLKTNLSLKKFPYQFNHLIDKLLQIEIKLDVFKSLEGFREEFNSRLDSESEDNKRILLFKEGRKAIFSCPINKYVSKISPTLIKDLPDISNDIPTLGDKFSEEAIKKYLDDLEEWIEETQTMLELKKYKRRSDINDIKGEVNSINHIYALLRQAYDLPEKFQDFLTFKKTILQTDYLKQASTMLEKEEEKGVKGQEKKEKEGSSHSLPPETSSKRKEKEPTFIKADEGKKEVKEKKKKEKEDSPHNLSSETSSEEEISSYNRETLNDILRHLKSEKNLRKFNKYLTENEVIKHNGQELKEMTPQYRGQIQRGMWGNTDFEWLWNALEKAFPEKFNKWLESED